MPMCSASGRFRRAIQRSLRSATRSCSANAARTARSGSSSCATGAPKTAITASPTNFSTKPSSRWIVADIASNSSTCNARRSSGSSVSLNAVKPDKSANSTVTGRRSDAAAGGAGTARRCPHFGQKANSDGTSYPQAVQAMAKLWYCGCFVRMSELALQAMQVRHQASRDEADHFEAERRVLEVQLLEAQLVDAQHRAVERAARGQRAALVGGEEGDLAEHAAGFHDVADLDEFDPSFGEEVQLLGRIALARQPLARLQSPPAHVRREPDARQVAGGGCLADAARQADHLGRAVEVDRQQRAVQQQRHRRPLQRAIDEKADVAADGEPAQRDHCLDEGAGDHQRDREARREDRDEFER